MALDPTRVGILAAELMEGLAEEYADADVEIGEVLIIAELRGEDEGEGWTVLPFRCSDPRAWIQRAMLREALDGKMHRGLRNDDELDEPPEDD